MSRKLKKASLWVRRRSHLPFLLVGGAVILLLFFNEETSVRLNMKYQKEISELKHQIKLNNDSADYYRRQRMELENDGNNLERVAREQYHMQRPSEDVYLLVEPASSGK